MFFSTLFWREPDLQIYIIELSDWTVHLKVLLEKPERMVNIVPRCIGHRNLLGQYIAISIQYEVSRITLSCCGTSMAPNS